MDKFNGIDMSVWQGRQDPEDGELALRWHDRVQPWQGNREPGVVLLGFACDEGVRRNKGRVGAAGAPLAVRKLLANTAWHLGASC
jgi:formiminoglutamase